ncbi:MAG: hypothetical protein ABJN34_11040 [Litoreibacter sp.]|uniref:hypothetical protein n=1 Tax=Litoreibacter sp. TaxID=1969459 RepID=UPI003296C631
MRDLDLETFKKVVMAGVVGELLFEAYSWLLSPILFGPILEPAKLVTAIVAKVTGVVLPYGPAFVIHFLIGSVLFALMVYALNKILNKGYVLAGLVTGLILWFVAQGMLAPFIGRPFMMEFGAYTQSSFIAHTSMMLVIGFVLSKLMASKPD